MASQFISLSLSFSTNHNKMFDPSTLLPSWLSVLLTEKFFNACLIHEQENKNEKNNLCLDCCISFCTRCEELHKSHRFLKIRRYVYHDVLKLSDINAANIIDCASIQSYTSNGVKVVFLNQRPLTENYRSHGKVCRTCDRHVQDSFLYCSLSCKIDHTLKTEGDLSQLLRSQHSDLEEVISTTPNSVLEPAGSMTSPRTSSGLGCLVELGCMALACTATTEIVRKKRSSLIRRTCRPVVSPPEVSPPVTEISTRPPSRRKGTPQRAPFY